MCPVCREPMIIAEWQGVEVDCCVRCRGTWLDAGELDWIATLAGVRDGVISDALQRADPGRRTPRRCPRCSRRLRAIHLNVRPAVELDRCPRGDGLWFDAGEIHAVISAFHDGEEQEVARLLQALHLGESAPQTKGD